MSAARIVPGLFLVAALAIAQTTPPHIALWPQNVSFEQEKVVERGANGVRNAAVSNIHNPSITVFLAPKDKATGASVVICPGGGHRYLAIDHEGYTVAAWLNSIGVAGIILKYRLSREEGTHYSIADAANDGRQAIRLVREHSKEWGLDPARVGIMGFSAGGDVAVRTGVIAQEGARPDFMALMYPLVPSDVPKPTADAPPAFISLASDDNTVIVEPTMKLYVDLRQAKVPVEMHIFAKGGHGFGIKPANHDLTATWTARFEDWLKTSGWLSR